MLSHFAYILLHVQSEVSGEGLQSEGSVEVV